MGIKNNLVMFHKFALLFTLSSVCGVSISNLITVKNCGRSLFPSHYSDRIVGGENVNPGEFPWLVSIRELDVDFGFEHVCGGAILNENWIVTAAHCIEMPNSPRKYEILAGLHRLTQENSPSVKKYKISKIVIHHAYDDDTFRNDLALLQTSKPIDIAGSKRYINGICLPTSKIDPTGYAIVSGWGYTREDGKNSDILQKVMVPIIKRDMCNEAYDGSIFDTMICAGITGRDSCQNDSGGPLIKTDKNGVSTLIGVVSHGLGCGVKFYPGIYTKVAMYEEWIKNVIS